jgi:hypothetical protein
MPRESITMTRAPLRLLYALTAFHITVVEAMVGDSRASSDLPAMMKLSRSSAVIMRSVSTVRK